MWQRLVHKVLHSNQKYRQNTIEIHFVNLKDQKKSHYIPKININGLDVVDNRNLFVSIWSKFKFNGQSIHFRNNTWDLPFTLFTGDKTLFDIN